MSEASPVTSKLKLYQLHGNPIAKLVEWQPALIELPFSDNWEAVEVEVNGVKLEPFIKKLAGQTRLLLQWDRQNAGRYHFKVKGIDEPFEEVISLNPSKLSEANFQDLLHDLETQLPAQIAIQLQKLGGMLGIDLLAPQETTVDQEYLRLVRAVLGTPTRLGLAKATILIATDPYQVLRSQHNWTRAERARRPPISRLVDALKPHNLKAGLPEKLWDGRTYTSVDVYENQLLALFLEQVRLRLRRLHRVSEQSNQKPQLSENIQQLERQLLTAKLTASFLNNVSLPDYLPQHVSMVLLKLPAYKAVLEGYLELNRSLAVRYEHPSLEAPLANLPYLYEVWGSLQVMSAFLEVGEAFGYQLRTERIFKRKPGTLLIDLLPSKSEVVLVHPDTKSTAKLVFQRSYGKSGEIHSISYTQIPDIAVELSQKGKTLINLYDPKYKLTGEGLMDEEESLFEGGPKKVDIDKMHAYRDAIRDKAGNRVVQTACILYPGPSKAFSDGIQALGAVPSVKTDLNLQVKATLEDLFELI